MKKGQILNASCSIRTQIEKATTQNALQPSLKNERSAATRWKGVLLLLDKIDVTVKQDKILKTKTFKLRISNIYSKLLKEIEGQDCNLQIYFCLQCVWTWINETSIYDLFND